MMMMLMKFSVGVMIHEIKNERKGKRQQCAGVK
jgi:hypothetical protein